MNHELEGLDLETTTTTRYPAGTEPANGWLTVQSAAAYAAVSIDTIYTACERRELQHVKIGGRRSIRIKAEWIDAWFEQHTVIRTRNSPVHPVPKVLV